MTNMVTNVVNTVKTLPSKIKSIAGDVVTGLWNGISNKVAWLKGKIKSFVGNVKDWLKSFFGIASPSKLMRDEIGRYIAEGIGVGIEDYKDSPLDAVKNLKDDMLGNLDELNGATINRKLATTFNAGNIPSVDNASLLGELKNIYDRLGRMQIVLDTGILVGETIDKIDARLASNQLLRARGV